MVIENISESQAGFVASRMIRSDIGVYDIGVDFIVRVPSGRVSMFEGVGQLDLGAISIGTPLIFKGGG